MNNSDTDTSRPATQPADKTRASHPLEVEIPGEETAGGAAQNAVFTSGSTMRHVLVMASTGAVGLVAIFMVDVLNLFYISLLGQQELAAAIGYSATIMFFSISVCIGFSIAATAVTARAIGQGKEEQARRNAMASLIYMFIMSILVSIFLFLTLEPTLSILGAKGETLTIAVHFMSIVLPSIPLMGLGMCLSGLLRARGDAKRAMYVTLSAALAAFVLDPLLIFGLDLGITGAAIGVFLVRVIMVSVGIYGAIIVHKMVAAPRFDDFTRVMHPFMVIAIPAVLTQIATPFGNAYVTASIAQFGDDAVAGWAIVGRLMPLAFAAVFSLSGAVGPILSQNYGAAKFDRVNSTMRDSLIFTLVYTVIIWSVLAVASPWIVSAFNAEADAAGLVAFFCVFVAGSFIFNGALFVANAAFNNLGNPVLSTVFNWGRATIGIIPFVYIGQAWGPNGVLAGWGIGGIVFGILAVIMSFRVLRKLPEQAVKEGIPIPSVPAANSPFTSGKGATFGPN